MPPTYYDTFSGNAIADFTPYEADPEKMEFLTKTTLARTTFGNDYLAYGRMIKPLEILNNRRISLDFTFPVTPIPSKIK